MKLVLYSISHHNTPVSVREKIAFSVEQRCAMLKTLHRQRKISEAAIIETCNRLEFYLYAAKDFDCEEAIAEIILQIKKPNAANIWRENRKEMTGQDVVKHLFEVAAGIDSQMIGENQVLSQVKQAYKTALECRTSHFLFHRLFHYAFRVGKAVRSQTNITTGAVSVALAAVELAKKTIEIASSKAMVIGAGENAQMVIHYLVKNGIKGVTIANRDTKKADELAQKYPDAKTTGLNDIYKNLESTDIVISSTSANEPLINFDEAEKYLKDRKMPLLLIDIAVPRDIDPKVAKFNCVTLYNIDDLEHQIDINKQKRDNEIPKARIIIEDYLRKFTGWYDSLSIVPVITDLTASNLELARSEAKRYASDFGAENQEKLTLFAESLVKKVLHGPITFLREIDDEQMTGRQLEAADLINKMFSLTDDER